MAKCQAQLFVGVIPGRQQSASELEESPAALTPARMPVTLTLEPQRASAIFRRRSGSVFRGMEGTPGKSAQTSKGYRV
jgi:hypothetical protein